MPTTDTSNTPTSTIGLNSSKALQYLLEEDPLLQNLNLTTLSTTTTRATRNNNQDDIAATASSSIAMEPPAFSYAAALIKNNDTNNANHNTNITTLHTNFIESNGIQQKAQDALSEVDRKLALVQSLSERISREKPEHVAAPLLKLHGYNVVLNENEPLQQRETDVNYNCNTTISSTLERCDRLKRQAQVLDSVANRVESTLERGLDRMSLATGKLDRVLKTSQVLKMIMRLRFEAKKVMGSGLDFDSLLLNSSGSSSNSNSTTYVDLRDLTRAAASVSIMEQLLKDLNNQGIDIVEQMRPEAERVAKAVRKAAAGLLAEQQQQHSSSTNSSNTVVSATKLGATLQVYYHLGELPDAVWNAVCLGLEKAQSANEVFLNPVNIKSILEKAKKDAKKIADEEIQSGGITDKKSKDIIHERTLQKKMREFKQRAAADWANGISDAALQVWNLHRVLSRKSDPVTREKFLDVVNDAPIPAMFDQAQHLLGTATVQQKQQCGGDNRQTDKYQKKVSLFSLFWNQMCISIGSQIENLLKEEGVSKVSDIATFFPTLRAAALEMLNLIQETMQAGSLSTSTNNTVDDLNGAGASCGIMGGSAVLDEAIFFGWGHDKLTNTKNSSMMHNDIDDNITSSGFGAVSADTWTKPDTSIGYENSKGGMSGETSKSVYQASSALSSIISSPEWYALQGSGSIGLYPLQRAFIKTMKERLNVPLKLMFVENRVVDENGIDINVLPSLPSLQDLKNLERCIRNELSLADPREGGGEFNMTSMISECIVDLVENLCTLAKGASSGVSEDKMLHDKTFTVKEEFLHDMKLVGVMSNLTSSLRKLPENAFVKPYRPAHTLQHEEAASMCQISLLPAMHEIESLVKSLLLNPLSRVLNRKIGNTIASMHRGMYVDSISGGMDGGSFVQEHVAKVYELIATNVLSLLPEEYGGIISATVATFSIYCFVSNASLVRPLGESGRLKITQDLGDLELILEQLMFKGGSSTTLNQINDGKPYAELRAVRQMLFWNGLENKDLSSEQIAKEFLREVWIKDVRPSTAFHFLLMFAPELLSSPHHVNHITVEEYVRTLVSINGSVEDGESASWMTTMKSCDSYQQRESLHTGGNGGDRRISAILMIIGPELLRRRRQ